MFQPVSLSVCVCVCQVSEVLAEKKTRLAISGWFHGPPIPRPPPYVEPAVPIYPCGGIGVMPLTQLLSQMAFEHFRTEKKKYCNMWSISISLTSEYSHLLQLQSKYSLNINTGFCFYYSYFLTFCCTQPSRP